MVFPSLLSPTFTRGILYQFFLYLLALFLLYTRQNYLICFLSCRSSFCPLALSLKCFLLPIMVVQSFLQRAPLFLPFAKKRHICCSISPKYEHISFFLSPKKGHKSFYPVLILVRKIDKLFISRNFPLSLVSNVSIRCLQLFLPIFHQFLPDDT